MTAGALKSRSTLWVDTESCEFALYPSFSLNYTAFKI